jgi:cardiolipin synthase
VKASQSSRAFIASLAMAAVVLLPAAAGTVASASTTSSVTSVWTEPQSGYGFLDSAIDAARDSIDLSMYALSDTTIERELIARAAAGVDVRVLLNLDYEGTHDNAASYTLLRASKVHVEWAPSNEIYHAKYVVIDGHVAYIGTGNLEVADYSSTRDFWVEDARASDVGAVSSTFDADFARSGAAASSSGGLVWSPGSTSALVRVIEAAKHSLLVENEEMDSPTIEAALKTAALRGITVKVVMTESSSWTAALDALVHSGVHVRLLNSSQVYIHAKVICVDCVGGAGTVFIGSENFSTSSLSYNRELGVITTTPKAVAAVDGAVNADYAQGATVVAPSTTPTKSSGSTKDVSITSFVNSISPGGEDALSVHSSKPNDTCDLVITLPSGYTSESRGLGSERANFTGNVTWTWEIGPSTDPGTARASITCAAGSVERDFAVR